MYIFFRQKFNFETNTCILKNNFYISMTSGEYTFILTNKYILYDSVHLSGLYVHLFLIHIIAQLDTTSMERFLRS
jgi:hypothetical protein